MEIWSKEHEVLKLTMKKEIGIMRELLSNLLYEEHLLTQKDILPPAYLQEDRSKLLKELFFLRRERCLTTRHIEKISHTSLEGKTLRALDQLLPPDNDNSSEILTLRDQILSLVSKVNSQKNRNLLLLQRHSYFPLQAKAAPSSKKRLATYVENE